MSKYVYDFKIKPASKIKIKKEKKENIISKLTTGICFLDNNTFKIKVSMRNSDNPSVLLLEFTDRSNDTINRTRLYSKESIRKGKPLCYIRDVIDSKFAPLNKKHYTPLCPNNVYSGYIVRVNGKMLFDLHDYVGINGCVNIEDKEDEEILKLT